MMARPTSEARLVVYDDSEVFGGHEVMTLRGLHALLEAGITVLFFHAKANVKLRQALENLQGSFDCLALQEYPTPSRKLQGIRNRFERRQIDDLARQFTRWGADAVLCAQGDLELSSRGILAAKRARLRAVSYIPFAHTLAEMGAKFGRFRDPFNRYLLQAPDAFLTISQAAAAAFKERGSRIPVEVVYNGIDVERLGGDALAARKRFGLPTEGRIIALCGRLERVQKGQQVLLEAIAGSHWLRENVTALLVGDGPDERFLVDEVERLGLASNVRFTGWCEPAGLYPALDALVIASRYEGMPLVMLEALVSEVPVLGTDRDGMRDLLPPEWRFPPGDIVALAEKLERLLKEPSKSLAQKLGQRVRQEMSAEMFRRNFTEAVIRQCQLTVKSP